MTKNEKRIIALKFGSKTGKLKKKHLIRAKFFLHGEENNAKLTVENIETLKNANVKI